MLRYSFKDAPKFRDSVRKFLDQEVEPFYEQWEDAGLWPRELSLYPTGGDGLA